MPGLNVFQARRDIDAVAVDVAVLDDHIAEIDADTELDPLVFRDRGVALGHPSLHRNGAGYRFDYARKLDQDAIAGRLDDAAFVFGDLWIDEFASMTPEPSEGASLIESHEPAISGDISGENGREPALDPLAQRFLPAVTRPASNR